MKLTVTGNPTPGGTLTVGATGTPGLGLFLGVGRPPGENLIVPWGPMFFNLTRHLRIIAFGAIPNTRNLLIPLEVSAPTDFVLQHLAIDWSKRARHQAGKSLKPGVPDNRVRGRLGGRSGGR